MLKLCCLILLISVSFQCSAAEMRRNIEKSQPKAEPKCETQPCKQEHNEHWKQFLYNGAIGQEKQAHILRDRR